MTRDVPLRAIRRTAWTTRVEILLPAGAPAQAEGIVDAVLADVDRAASRFRPDSEVSALVRAEPEADGRVRAQISPLLTDLLVAADRAHRLSEGMVDPCLGAEEVACGYGSAPGAPIAAEAAPARRGVRWSDVILDADSRRIDLPAGTLLDLGATAKARTADLLASRLSALADGAGVLVNLGGDIAVAGTAPRGGWILDIAGASVGTPGAQIALHDGAIATSSTRLRAWDGAAGTRAHHVIDPRTGVPARTPWAEASVIAGTCLDANTAATCALVLGEDAPAHLQRHRLAARLVGDDGRLELLGAWARPAADLSPAALPALVEAGAPA